MIRVVINISHKNKLNSASLKPIMVKLFIFCHASVIPDSLGVVEAFI